MSDGSSPPSAAVPGLTRSDPHSAGITRVRISGGLASAPLARGGSYIATRAGGHFTAKQFRTWNATVLMALLAGESPAD